jgi:CHAD domain-containing protein
MDDPSRKSPASILLMSYVDDQVQMIRQQEARVRQDEPDAVHKMRIAIRRLRATLATYRRLLDPDVVAHLREELKWLAGTSGPARDAQVMHERLAHLLAAQPAELVIGPVSQRVDDKLNADFAAGRHEALDALDSERHARLLDALDALVADPPLTPRASKPAHKTVPHLVAKAGKRLRHAVEVATTVEGAERDVALHEVRKCAKRLRYAAEVATPVRPKRAVKLTHAAHELQRTLGDHHDSAVARDLLLGLAAEAHRRGESDLTYGRLHALEQAQAAESETQFLQAWEDMPKTSL